MQLHREVRHAMKRNLLYARAALFISVMTCAGAPRLSAQSDPQPLLQQLTSLMQQTQDATDACPLMPKLRSLIDEVANQSPEVYQAMKPALDLLNQDDTCADSKTNDPSGDGAASPRPPAENTGDAKSPGTQICPSSGFIDGGHFVDNDVWEGRRTPCAPGQSVSTGSSGESGTGGSTGPSSNSSGSSGSSGGGNTAVSGISGSASSSQSACATSPSGSSLPMAPGTTASTCNPAVCREMGFNVHLLSQWHDAQKTDAEVVGYLSNDTVSDATCTWAFHRNGQWGDFGTLSVKAGQQHYGGEGGGIWTMGADSSDMRYICFAGIDPVDEHGNSCFANVKFTGQTRAGTDK